LEQIACLMLEEFTKNLEPPFLSVPLSRLLTFAKDFLTKSNPGLWRRYIFAPFDNKD
jgi:hypothetical protein